MTQNSDEIDNIERAHSEPAAEAADDGSESDGADRTTLTYGESSSTDVQYETTPTIRPVLLTLAAVVIGGLVIVGSIATNPALLGGAQIADIIGSAILVLTSVVAIRLLIKAAVLARTTYTITDDTFRREYELLYRTRSRVVPVAKLRGHEFSQGRVQSLLGYGTIRLLTAGTNRSLGFIEFEHLDDPERTREEIRAVSTARTED
ncbi:PH domain-containing protein [Natrinema halophilum]|uniref:PH domain-containing protein n=1 Tax=Natrinema halophilum TaxID=1699371 RepID=A0A7D5K8Q5_9EURY|nr:PH domain-containing protein [Natrinema halophilum]QLG50923.1 PH domain-containing protein [Natrinema halophilum]